jgi:hypothetical protein
MSVIINGTTGVTFPNNAQSSPALTIQAGTATLAPLTLTAGTNLSTPVAGSFEYDGFVPYFTPESAIRGIIPAEQFIALTGSNTVVGTSSTSLQNVFSGVGASVTLPVGTYRFRGLYAGSKTSGTSWVYNTAFGGTATIASIQYTVIRYYSTSGYSSANVNPSFALITTASAATTMTSSSASTIYMLNLLEGIVQISVAGTLTPQYSTTGSSVGAVTHAAPTFFAISPLSGSASGNIIIGSWA